MTTIHRNPPRDKLPDLQPIAARLLGGPGKPAGRGRKYRSPFRTGDNDPSLVIYSDGWKDYGTGEGGNTYDFICKYLNISFPQAVAYADGQPINTKIGSHPHGKKDQTATSDPPPLDWQKAMAEEAERHHDYLMSDRPDARQVRTYSQARGLNDETIRPFQLGYNPTWRKTAYTDPETGKSVWIPPGIVIPVRCDGALWALHIRCRVGSLAEALGIPADTDPDGSELDKYRYAKGSKPTGAVFNGDAVQPGRDVLIVEGEFDAMLAQQQLGSETAVITLGSASNRLPARWRERLQNAGRIHSILDNDRAGKVATEALSKLLGDRHQAISLPEGKDITDYVMEHGGHTAALFIQGKAPFPNGLPEAIRRARKYRLASLIYVLDMINECLRRGLLSEPRFTISGLQEAAAEFGWEIATQTLRDTLDVYDGVITRKLIPESLGCIPTDFRVNSSTNTDKGRKPDVYELLPVAEMLINLKEQAAACIFEKHNPTEGDNATFMRFTGKYLKSKGVPKDEVEAIAQEVNERLQPAYRKQGYRERFALEQALEEYRQFERDLNDPNSIPLPTFAVKSAAQYTVLRARAIVEQNPDVNRSRPEWAALLGVSESMLDSIFMRAGIGKEEDFTKVEITSSLPVEQQVKHAAREHRGFPDLWSYEEGGRTIKQAYVKDESPRAIEQQIRAGARVTVRLQVANKHHIVTAAPPLILHQSPSTPKLGITIKRAPVKKPYFGPGYDPEWERGQIKLGLSLLGWQVRDDGQMVNRETNAVNVTPKTPREFIEWVIGREIAESWDIFRELGAELGAVMSITEARAIRPAGDGWQEVPLRRVS